MKKTVAFSLVTGLLISASSAITSVGLGNWKAPFTAENAVTIVDNAGTPLGAVNYGIGTYSGSDFSSAEAVRANFSELGTNTTTSIHFAPTTNSTDVTSPQDSTPVYVVFYGNADGTAAADLASAVEFIVFEGNSNYIVEDAVLGASFSVSLVNSTLQYGTSQTSNNDGVSGPFTGFTNGVTFGGAIPEPSTALLSLVGLAFVARRRR
ncbi:PEP-CTERM sorting domain-containing protein [Akkermansiaceae bacterium]|nr:PEP-CTERM sorting domain-containing protein [Akkermansiaceae bacterium]MDB4302284.1 PEP-CTERM sorting domain-containing protein [bacterium]